MDKPEGHAPIKRAPKQSRVSTATKRRQQAIVTAALERATKSSATSPTRRGATLPTLRRDASPITLSAIKAIAAETLYRLLSLDGPNVEALRPSFASRAEEATGRAATAEQLVRDLERLWFRVETSMGADPRTWSRALGKPNYRSYARAEMARLTAGAVAVARQARREANSRRAAKPRHDDKGVTSTPHVGPKLVELVERLRGHDCDQWTIRAVAELIRASQDDWQPAPCPELARRYARNIDALGNWIKTRIARERKRARGRRTGARNNSVL